MKQKYVKEAFDTNWVVPMGPNRRTKQEQKQCLHLHYALQGGGKAPKGINLGEAHRKHAYQLMANELRISHPLVSCLYMALQLLVSVGFVWGCGALAQYLHCSLALVHWVYLICALVLLAVANVLFMRKYYWMHEEYLKGLVK